MPWDIRKVLSANGSTLQYHITDEDCFSTIVRMREITSKAVVKPNRSKCFVNIQLRVNNRWSGVRMWSEMMLMRTDGLFYSLASDICYSVS